MAKLYVLNPLAVLAMQHGMTRSLDRNDFDGGHVPRWAGEYVPRQGSIDWGGPNYAAYTGLLANLSINQGDTGSGSDMYSFGTTQLHPLGTIAATRDGRVFRYATAGAAALVAGNLQQSAAAIANHLALTSAAQAIGDGSYGKQAPIVVTPGNTAGAANLYAEGFLNVDTTPGNGQMFRISGHAAITASTAFNLYLDNDDLLQVAFTTATRYGLIHNPFKNVIVAPTTNTAALRGWAVSAIPANTTAQNYGWLQTKGLVSALINGTPGIGVGVVQSVTTAGAVDVAAVAAEVNVRIVGHMAQVGVSTKNNLVYALLD